MSKQVLNALPELVKEGIISPEISDGIKAYYKQKEARPESRMNLVFAILGTILVSLGIILMVAHNWDNLSRPVKLFFSFLPLVIGQALCGYVLYKKKDDRGLKESAATFLFFAIGTVISLVSQTYHIEGSFSSLLFTWMLLGFPLIYIMQSSLVSLLYITGITVYAVAEGYALNNHGYHYFWLILLVLPHFVSLLKNKPQSNFTAFQNWFIPLSLTICLGILAGKTEELMFVAYMNLFAIFYLFGSTAILSDRKLLSNGFLVIGSLGTIIILLMASFKFFWGFVMDDFLFGKALPQFPDMLSVFITAGIAFFLLTLRFKEWRAKPVGFTEFVFLLFGIIFCIGYSSNIVAVIAVNLLILSLAVFIMYRGHQLNHLGILNYGLLIITALVICRFFDTNISFVLRGLMFLAVGAGFFIANYKLIQKRKQHEK